MKNYFDEIRQKLKQNFEFEKLEIVDNSLKHKGHKFFSEKQFHLKLIIGSKYLKSIRINAQKLIMKVLKDDLKKIHALEIKIE